MGEGGLCAIYSLDDESHCTQPLQDLSRQTALLQSPPDQFQLGALHYLLAKWL